MSYHDRESDRTAAIRPFTVPVTPKAELEALRARIASTRWPDVNSSPTTRRACSWR